MSTLPFSQTYANFFARSAEERHVFLRGGRRSGKTFATARHLNILATVMLASGRVKSLTILTATYQYPQLQATIKDFEQAINLTVTGSNIDGLSAHTHGGRVLWQFRAFDDYTKTQGTQCDYLFINEAVNMPEPIAMTLAMSARLQIFYNYNPTKSFFGEKLINGNNLLVTTWRDNDYLTEAQRAEFEAIKERAQRPNATLFDEYQYQVYYLGNHAKMVGAVFTALEYCDDATYRDIPAVEVLGLDFGFATSGDPTVLVGVKYHDSRIYVKEYIYERGLTSDKELAQRIVACGFNYATPIVGDYGGMGRGRMDSLITADNGKWAEPELRRGFSIVNAPKGGIMDGLSQMLAADAVVITTSSVNARNEFERYELNEQQKPVGDDHAIDAARYAFSYLKRIS